MLPAERKQNEVDHSKQNALEDGTPSTIYHSGLTVGAGITVYSQEQTSALRLLFSTLHLHREVQPRWTSSRQLLWSSAYPRKLDANYGAFRFSR